MKIEGRKVLVTGGAGFIGSHIVESLVRLGAEVTVYDDFSSGSLRNLSDVKKSVRVVRGDIMDYPRLKRAMKGAEIVSHQAAQLEITKCIDDPIDDLQHNTVGTLNVLNAAVAHGVEKLIAASSACVYGQAKYIPQDEAKHPTNPNWAYGAAKLAAEKYCGIYSDLYDMPTVCLRYGIIYGPREWYGRVLTIFLKRALANRPPVVFGTGRQLRDFTYVGDVVSFHDACLKKATGRHEVFNVSTGIPTSVRKLAGMISRATGRKLRPVFEDVAVGERSEHVDENRMRLPSELQRMVLDPAKGMRKLRWRPTMSLAEGLREEYRWLESDPTVWDKMSY